MKSAFLFLLNSHGGFFLFPKYINAISYHVKESKGNFELYTNHSNNQELLNVSIL